MTVPPITAELLGSNRIRCGAVELRHRTPILALARRLLADGADPTTLLTVCWARTGTVAMIEPLGKLAGLDVFEEDGGRRGFRPYRPKPPRACGRDDATAAGAGEPVSSYPEPEEPAPRPGRRHPARARLQAAE